MTAYLSSLLVLSLFCYAVPGAAAGAYFPPPGSKGGWRRLSTEQDRRDIAGLDTAGLEAAWEYVRLTTNPFTRSCPWALSVA